MGQRDPNYILLLAPAPFTQTTWISYGVALPPTLTRARWSVMGNVPQEPRGRPRFASRLAASCPGVVSHQSAPPVRRSSFVSREVQCPQAQARGRGPAHVHVSQPAQHGLMCPWRQSHVFHAAMPRQHCCCTTAVRVAYMHGVRHLTSIAPRRERRGSIS